MMMLEWISGVSASDWVSGIGTVASVVALCLALLEWRRVKAVREETERQRDYLSKLHFLTDDLRQLREHLSQIEHHRRSKRWEHAAREMRACLGSLQAARERVGEEGKATWESVDSEMRQVIEQIVNSEGTIPTSIIMSVIGNLDGLIRLMNNALNQHHWRQTNE